LVSQFDEEHRLRVFENRILRRILGPKREEDGSWRKLYNDELHSLSSSPNIVRVIKARRLTWARHVALMEEGVLVGRPKGKILLGRPRQRWEDNVKMDFREIGINGGIGFGWLRIGSSGDLCEHGNEHSSSIETAGYCLKI
jgi:hypothetical protein